MGISKVPVDQLTHSNDQNPSCYEEKAATGRAMKNAENWPVLNSKLPSCRCSCTWCQVTSWRVGASKIWSLQNLRWLCILLHPSSILVHLQNSNEGMFNRGPNMLGSHHLGFVCAWLPIRWHCPRCDHTLDCCHDMQNPSPTRHSFGLMGIDSQIEPGYKDYLQQKRLGHLKATLREYINWRNTRDI